jgi:peptidyl-tRNA hydrolase
MTDQDGIEAVAQEVSAQLTETRAALSAWVDRNTNRFLHDLAQDVRTILAALDEATARAERLRRVAEAVRAARGHEIQPGEYTYHAGEPQPSIGWAHWGAILDALDAKGARDDRA